jgi:hypothetical protein
MSNLIINSNKDASGKDRFMSINNLGA